MFWNDPSLYGATLPYKEIGTFPYKEFGTVPMPFMGPTFNPWQTFPRFVPPVYGTLPYYFDPRMFVQPWMQTPQINPFMQPLTTPFAQIPPITPFVPPFNVNLPLHNLYRPFPY
jgi:hypothetical protein